MHAILPLLQLIFCFHVRFICVHAEITYEVMTVSSSYVLRDQIQWLLVQQRIQFKFCPLAFKALHGLALTYLADLCQPVASVGSRQRLPHRQHDCHVLWCPVIRRSRTQSLESPSGRHSCNGLKQLFYKCFRDIFVPLTISINQTVAPL